MMMRDSVGPNDPKEDDYNEEADSDFEAASDNASESTDSSDEDEENPKKDGIRTALKRRPATKYHPQQGLGDLDSGDEATIKERQRARRKQKRKGEILDEHSEHETEGWRTRTRAMREKEQNEHRVHKLASTKYSNIDVDRLWEEMNKPGPLRTPQIGREIESLQDQQADQMQNTGIREIHDHADKENMPKIQSEDVIIIKRTYKFAGETHTEERTVPKSSAEARLYLAQQAAQPQATQDGRIIQRPLRKVSRFDPNSNNVEAFKSKWTTDGSARNPPAGTKLNVVEKSKMDWAVHVDAEGLKEELDEHAKARGGYLGRMDFLNEVEQRKEADARAARLKMR